MALSSRLRCPGQGRSPRRPWNAQSVTPLWARRPLPQPAVGALSPRHLLPAALPPDDTWFRVCCVSPKSAGLPAGGRKHEAGEEGACSAPTPWTSAGPSARSPRADAARPSCPLQDAAGTGWVFPRPRRTCLGGRSSQTHRLRSASNEAGSGTRSRQRPGARPRPDARDPRSAGRGEGGSCAGSVQMSDFGQRSASEATPPPATTCHRGQSRPQRPTPGPTSARTLEGAGAAPPKRQWVSSPQRHAGTLLISACSYTRHPRAPSPSAPRFSYESQWISASAVLKSTLTPGSFRRCSQPEWEQGHRPQCSWPAPRARA